MQWRTDADDDLPSGTASPHASRHGERERSCDVDSLSRLENQPAESSASNAGAAWVQQQQQRPLRVEGDALGALMSDFADLSPFGRASASASPPVAAEGAAASGAVQDHADGGGPTEMMSDGALRDGVDHLCQTVSSPPERREAEQPRDPSGGGGGGGGAWTEAGGAGAQWVRARPYMMPVLWMMMIVIIDGGGGGGGGDRWLW
eukprot:COSAG01_NODE_3708_length_5771_cov_15.214210_5_plen_204_part_00